MGAGMVIILCAGKVKIVLDSRYTPYVYYVVATLTYIIVTRGESRRALDPPKYLISKIQK